MPSLSWPLLAVILGAARGDNVLVRPWGDNALRIQISPSDWTLTDNIPSAIIPGSAPFTSDFRAAGATVTSGNIEATQGADGTLTIIRVSDGAVLLTETARSFASGQSGAVSNVTFAFPSSKKLYGMGQNRLQDNGGGLGLNVLGNTYSFQGSIGEEGGPSNSLPYVIGGSPSSGFAFGLLFNSPSLGGVSFTNTSMTWSIIADDGNQFLRRQFDFLVSTHAANATAAERAFQITEKYVDAVGHARKMPYPGYWHSKNRYSSQEELLTAARGFHNRSIPVDVIVIDWFHWKIMGDWSFNPDAWPDPQAMVDECRSYGMEIMVSVWPFTCPGSRSFDTLVKNNWVTTYVGADGNRTDIPIETHGKGCHHVDATNPDFRKYAWSLIESGYYKYGIKIFWLDASEPEGFGPLATNASWSAGNMRDMGSLFTWYWTQVFHDGLTNAGETDIVMLPRAGWVGTWRWGAALWSGDIKSTMSVLRSQVNIGLSAQASGIPWWTTDIGGYSGGNSQDPTYRETIVRWFQYGMTCPLFRQHGARDHTAIWWYGNESEQIIGDIIKLRASMKPYFSAQLDALNATGRPFNRPLMWDFPEDPMTWKLAESGIGDSNTTSNSSEPHALENGDFVVLAKCTGSWSQTWTNTSIKGADCVRLTSSVAGEKCIDNGGTVGGDPPRGPYKIHMWSPGWPSAQAWTYNAGTKQFAGRSGCLSADGDGVHPTFPACDTSDPKQQWTFTDGGTIENDAQCLTVVDQTTTSIGVADQYMMGDSYMVAPILNFGQRSRLVYFPVGANWQHHYTSTVYKGGTTAMVDAPLSTFPLFLRLAPDVVAPSQVEEL